MKEDYRSELMKKNLKQEQNERRRSRRGEVRNFTCNIKEAALDVMLFQLFSAAVDQGIF